MVGACEVDWSIESLVNLTSFQKRPCFENLLKFNVSYQALFILAIEDVMDQSLDHV